MTEYNLFCYSEKFDDDDSFQQARHRAFNQFVGKQRYDELIDIVNKILRKSQIKLLDFWQQVTKEQWQQLLAIPEAKNFKEGFEFIADVKINTGPTDVEAAIKLLQEKGLIKDGKIINI